MISEQKTITIFLLMAGRGERFRQSGFEGPKAMILWNERPLFRWSLESVSRIPNVSLYLVTCAEDEIKASELLRWAPEANIVELSSRTRGPAETALRALQQAEQTEKKAGPVIFCDCDLISRSAAWESFIQNWHDQSAATVHCFTAQETKHSFAKINTDGDVTEIAEKIRISDQAVAGVYAFANAEIFKAAVQNLDFSGSEKYISHVYQELLRQNKKIKSFAVDEMRLLGTPPDLSSAERFNP